MFVFVESVGVSIDDRLELPRGPMGLNSVKLTEKKAF
jgi:hypothetical protein